MAGSAMKKHTGFTLIELMIVIVIIAILAAIAFPSYQKSIQKSRRADGRAGIVSIQLAQEKRRGNCVFYAQTIGASDVCDSTMGVTNIVGGSAASPEGYYNVSIQAGTATGNNYVIQAVPQGAQNADDCGTLTLTQAGVKGVTGSGVGCW